MPFEPWNQNRWARLVDVAAVIAAQDKLVERSDAAIQAVVTFLADQNVIRLRVDVDETVRIEDVLTAMVILTTGGSRWWRYLAPRFRWRCSRWNAGAISRSSSHFDVTSTGRGRAVLTEGCRLLVRTWTARWLPKSP